MNVSSERVDNFHYYNQLELLLLILVCIHMSRFVFFGKNVVPIGHGNLFLSVLESHEKVMENDFRKRMVTLIRKALRFPFAEPQKVFELLCFVRAGEILYSLALSSAYHRGASSFPESTLLTRCTTSRRQLGLFQHHDGITGTARDFVVINYGDK